MSDLKKTSYVTRRIVQPSLFWLSGVLGGFNDVLTIVQEQSSALSSSEPDSYSLNGVLQLASIAQSRAANLTGHISIMMGATIFIGVSGIESTLMRVLLVLDLGLYAFCMIICLYASSSLSMNSNFSENISEDSSHKDIALRFWSLQIANSVLVIATLLFFFIGAMEIFWSEMPEGN